MSVAVTVAEILRQNEIAHTSHIRTALLSYPARDPRGPPSITKAKIDITLTKTPQFIEKAAARQAEVRRGTSSPSPSFAFV